MRLNAFIIGSSTFSKRCKLILNQLVSDKFDIKLINNQHSVDNILLPTTDSWHETTKFVMFPDDSMNFIENRSNHKNNIIDGKIQSNPCDLEKAGNLNSRNLKNVNKQDSLIWHSLDIYVKNGGILFVPSSRIQTSGLEKRCSFNKIYSAVNPSWKSPTSSPFDEEVTLHKSSRDINIVTTENNIININNNNQNGHSISLNQQIVTNHPVFNKRSTPGSPLSEIIFSKTTINNRKKHVDRIWWNPHGNGTIFVSEINNGSIDENLKPLCEKFINTLINIMDRKNSSSSSSNHNGQTLKIDHEQEVGIVFKTKATTTNIQRSLIQHDYQSSQANMNPNSNEPPFEIQVIRQNLSTEPNCSYERNAVEDDGAIEKSLDSFKGNVLKRIVSQDNESEWSIQTFTNSLKAARQREQVHQFGNIVLHSKTISSTQTILFENQSLRDALPPGSVYVANNQVAGKGRNDNKWISQSGCLQFSLLLKSVDVSKSLFIQYLMALAVCKAIKSLTFHEFPIFIKWPNDIYFKTAENNLVKAGGILVQSSFFKGNMEVVIGVGLNVGNPKPTLCINEMLSKLDKNVKELTREQVLAETLVHFEKIWSQFEKEGFNPFLKEYYQLWLHSEQQVSVKDDKGREFMVKLIGIGSDGFLCGIDEQATLHKLHPDGNSFDLLRGLIVAK